MQENRSHNRHSNAEFYQSQLGNILIYRDWNSTGGLFDNKGETSYHSRDILLRKNR